MKHKILILLFMAIAQLAFAQSDSVQFTITISDPSAISSYTFTGLPVFTNSEINGILSSYNITDFSQAYPDSRLQYLRNVYKVRCNSIELATTLNTADPILFPLWERKYQPALCFTPNDMYIIPGGSDYLKYINAEDAWDITHGNPKVVIGITDNYLYTSHPDFYNTGGASKIERVGPNIHVANHHGTAVSSIVAGATNNGIGLPAIGFDCRIDFSSNYGDDNEVLLMSKRGRRIINGSWLNGATSTLNLRDHFYAQGVYNEIYENGSMPCFAAANGVLNWIDPDDFAFPASYDHVISTTSIGWKNETGTYNVKGVHELLVGDEANTFNHNTRVDICAPSWDIGAFRYDPSNPTFLYYTSASGTSASSPMVAGTAGLIQSALKARTGPDVNYSPYQLEWILKESANPDMLSLSENAKYAGKLGVGRLDAEAAALFASTILDPNDPATQTMYIKGLEINTICAPGFASNGALPKLKPIIINGVAPFTYVWEEVPGGTNAAVLDNEDIAEPTITGLKTGVSTNLLYYRLTVYDNSNVQKVAMKTFKVQLKTSGYDLAMRDSYVDMFNEPNDQRIFDPREWDTWTSPDIWNRQAADGGLEHQNPEYFTTDPNHVYVRVRNVGCSPSPASSKLKLYWTKSSTGENWDVDWKVSDVCGIGALQPGGREITTGAGISLPALQPGDATIIHQDWFPVQPELYCGGYSSIDVCFLGRIEENPSYPFGITIPEKYTYTPGYGGVGENIRNNNNIVTRNMVLTNLKPDNLKTMRRILTLANGNDVATRYNFEFASERSIFQHFAGDFSSLGSVTFHLGDLYDVWVASGSNGTVASQNSDNRTVTFDGANTLRLDNIPFAANERYTVEVEFTLDSPLIVNEVSNHIFHARQFDVNNPDEAYGAVNYQVTVSPANQSKALLPPIDSHKDKSSLFNLSPNPTNGIVSILYTGEIDNSTELVITDIAGKKIMGTKAIFTPGSVKTITLSGLAAGTYLVKIVDVNGKTEVHTVVKE